MDWGNRKTNGGIAVTSASHGLTHSMYIPYVNRERGTRVDRHSSRLRTDFRHRGKRPEKVCCQCLPALGIISLTLSDQRLVLYDPFIHSCPLAEQSLLWYDSRCIVYLSFHEA
jgi:hypothetical protein